MEMSTGRKYIVRSTVLTRRKSLSSSTAAMHRDSPTWKMTEITQYQTLLISAVRITGSAISSR